MVKGGKGLAAPLYDYTGVLEKTGQKPHEELMAFYQFLDNSSILRSALDLERLEEDLEQGLEFKSDIPQGAGVGSSGALCAAIYKTYQKNPTDLESRSFSEVMDHLALMEAFYHGSSSGLDPLISFAQRPALVTNRNKVEFGDFSSDSADLWLYNSRRGRKTSPLVHQFLKMCEDEDFAGKTSEFIKISDDLILSFIRNDRLAFDDLFHKLSKWQYLNLKPMVCPEVDAFWLEGLESKKYYVKLCGAGGGGHYIVYKRDPKAELPADSIKIKF